MAKVNKSQEKPIYVQIAEMKEMFALDDEADCYREGDNGLTAQQWQAISLLVIGKKQVDVAHELGITQETLSRWKGNPVFVAALNVAVRDCYMATVGEVRDLARDAVSALRDILDSDDDRLRLSAALAVLRLHMKLDEGAPLQPVTPGDVARQRVDRAMDHMITDGLF